MALDSPGLIGVVGGVVVHGGARGQHCADDCGERDADGQKGLKAIRRIRFAHDVLPRGGQGVDWR